MSSPSTPPHSAPNTEITLPETSMPTSNIDLNPSLESSDESGDERVGAWTEPFDQVFSRLKAAFYSQNPEALSLDQQSKFVTYTDGEILLIQRKFIKHQANPENAYPLETVLRDVQHVLDFVWRSVNVQTPLFGQEEYYLRVLGDLEEWLEYYELPAAHVTLYVQLFTFLQSVDVHLSFLADGYSTPNAVSKLSGTFMVRLTPLITRLRQIVITKVESIRSGRVGDIMDLEVGRLFEGLLERI